MIELLLDAGANPNTQLKLLPPYRSVGADRGADGMLTIGTTPLLRAAKGLDAPAITLLLEARRASRHSELPRRVAYRGRRRTGISKRRHARIVHHLRCSTAFYRFPRSASESRRQHQCRCGKRTVRSARRNHLGMERRHSVPRRTRRQSERAECPGSNGSRFPHGRPRRRDSRTERNRSTP